MKTWHYLAAAVASIILATNWFMFVGPYSDYPLTFIRFNLAVWPALGLVGFGAWLVCLSEELGRR